MSTSLSEPVEPARLVNARRFLMGITTNHSGDVLSLLSPDVVYTVTGHHPLAGVFHGPVEVDAYIRKLFRVTSNTIDILQWVDWLVGATHVAALQFAQVEGGRARYRNHHIFVIETDQNDLLTNIRFLFEDQAAADRFFGQLPEG
jgi:ketosteroid isomerase-like protein